MPHASPAKPNGRWMHDHHSARTVPDLMGRSVLLQYQQELEEARDQGEAGFSILERRVPAFLLGEHPRELAERVPPTTDVRRPHHLSDPPAFP